MTVATRPDFFVGVPVLDKANKANTKTTEEEQMYFTLSKSAGWKQFVSEAEEAIKQLGELNNTAIASGAPIEEIGRNAIVINLAQEAIRRLLDKVSDAAEAVEGGR